MVTMLFHCFVMLTCARLFVNAMATPIECTDAAAASNWPTFHVMNAVTRCDPADMGKCNPWGLTVEHLNDANAIFEYKGIYHVMNQGGYADATGPKVNWTHAVSNDLIRWYRVKDSVSRIGPGYLQQGACDGTVSFPGEPISPSGAPVLMWGPDCADGDGFPHMLGDYPRAAIARPANPADPLLIEWVKGPHNVSFVNGTQQTEPCSFPGKVWKSETGNYWNMLCSPHWTGNWGGPWARYETTDTTLQTWTLADNSFIQHDSTVIHVDAASGAMFNPIPNAVPGGPTHMINGVTGQAFWTGTYDPKTEKFNITSDELHWLDIGGGGGGFSGGAAHWAATSNSFSTRPKDADNRLLWVAWVSSAGRGNANVLSLVRQITWDPVASQLISFPVPEYAQLRNATFLDQQKLGLLHSGTIKTLDTIPGAAGGALDVSVSFDLSATAPHQSAGRFGIALRAPAAGSGTELTDAAQNVWFEVGPASSDGVRNVTVVGVLNGPGPPLPPKPYPCNRNKCPSNVTRLYPKETLDVRVLVDRPVIEVYVLGGRIAWVHQDNQFDVNRTSVHVYNHGASPVTATKVSAYGMGCGWRSDLPTPKVSTTYTSQHGSLPLYA